MEAATLETFDGSLRRCDANAGFLDLFYERFLASSPEVRARFENTDFDSQKRALRGSLDQLRRAARHGHPEKHLLRLAELHGAHRLNIGAELYDLWLNSLLETVEQCDPAYGPEVAAAWEAVTAVGIRFLLSHYHHPPDTSPPEDE